MGLTLTETEDEKTKQINAQLCFAQKTLRLTKNHPDEFGVASLKMIKKWIKKCSTLFRTKNTAFNKNHTDDMTHIF